MTVTDIIFMIGIVIGCIIVAICGYCWGYVNGREDVKDDVLKGKIDRDSIFEERHRL